MVIPLRPDRRYATGGDRKTVRGEDLHEQTLRADNKITVFAHEIAADKVGWWGHGYFSDGPGRTSYIKGNIVDTEGNPIEGDLYVAVTDSDGDALARRTLTDLEDLREAAEEARTDRPEMPAMSADGNAAGAQRNLELQIDATDGDDDATVDPEASELKVYFTTN